MTEPSAEPNAEAGFTLVEVIAAFAILALSFSVLMSAMSDGLRRSGGAAIEAEAGSLVQSLLARAGTETPLKAEETTGQTDGGLRWRLTMTPSGEAEAASPVAAFRVTAEVFWRDGFRHRSLALSTLRLGPGSAR
jgi:general secretion pathway protein I